VGTSSTGSSTSSSVATGINQNASP
jgi:hypothetical protein